MAALSLLHVGVSGTQKRLPLTLGDYTGGIEEGACRCMRTIISISEIASYIPQNFKLLS